MRNVRRLWAVVQVTAKRLIAQPGLTLATLTGIVIAIGLAMSVPVYADAVYFRTFSTNIEADADVEAPRPPFALMFYYGGGLAPAVELDAIQAADAILSSRAADAIGLPREFLVRHARTEAYPVFPLDETSFDEADSALTLARFGYISGIAQHITLVEGTFPTPIQPDEEGNIDPSAPVDVLVSEGLAFEIGLQAGELYTVYVQQASAGGITRAQEVPVRIAGVWSPVDPLDTFWFIQPGLLENQLLMPEASFVNRIAPAITDEVFAAIWYLVLDGSGVHYSEAGALVGRINEVLQDVTNALPETRLAVSPNEDLVFYQQSANLLTVLLYAFGLPIIGLLLAFLGLTAGLAVEQRRNEVAVLRSRGALTGQMIGIAGLEGLLLGGLGLAIAAPLSLAVAQLIGQTRGFLDFTARADLRLTLSGSTMLFGVFAVTITLLALVLPTLSASRQTILSYKRQRARSIQRAWWQRLWLDGLLFIPAAYGFYLLQQQGTLTTDDALINANPFENPLLFLVPSLGILALTLFFLRLMPLLMGVITWLLAQTNSVGLLMAVRHLARTPGLYTTPLLLLVLTVSLSAFTASLAETLDGHVDDQMYYRVGADVRFFDFGETAPADSSGSSVGSLFNTGAESDLPAWRFLPLTDYTAVEGVHAAARVGDYETLVTLSGRLRSGRFMGIDRLDFPAAAFWRRDFAQESLGALMNTLAAAPDGVLVPRDLWDEFDLSVGDTLQLNIRLFGPRVELDFRVAGVFDLFPTWYPDDGPLFVGNLDYLFSQVGGRFPYDVWLAAEPGITPQTLDVPDLNWDAAEPRIRAEQARPQRQGIFGLLSVGFAAAAVLTVLGFLLYVLFSFRRRLIEMGVLRAIGLSARQMVTFLTWELAFLIVMGGAVGTGLGVLISQMFIPFLQVGSDATASTPPFIVEIAWDAILRVYGLFGLLFVLALVVLAFLLRRMQIFQAIKLGETV